MYAVSGGHLNTVKELMKYEFLKCDHQNEVHKNQLVIILWEFYIHSGRDTGGAGGALAPPLFEEGGQCPPTFF